MLELEISIFIGLWILFMIYPIYKYIFEIIKNF